MSTRWDIFCTVIDNYGDIGVTWRLARQLAAEHGLAVRLWVDDLHAFARLCPGADPLAQQQQQAGVDVRQWQAPTANDEQATGCPGLGITDPADTADVVVGAFGCGLPADYREALRRRAKPALWLNLEYLSAEAWVTGCHGLPSPQPDGLRKVFFFPGFIDGTGGLLRERELLTDCARLQSDPSARRAFLARLGVTPRPQARVMSLFAYENPQLGNWLAALAHDPQPTDLLVPEGRILDDLRNALQLPTLAAGDTAERGSLRVQVLPFVSQPDYDRLLWCCDFNAVRGEDSFVRAQWAGQPLLWHIYVQQEQAHLEKLDAFLGIYRQGLSEDAAQALAAVWHAWNMDLDMRSAWQGLQLHWAELQAHALAWRATQAARSDLATALVHFYRNWL